MTIDVNRPEREAPLIEGQAHTVRETDKLVAGQWIVLHVNQGNRDAKVLAVIGDQALVEYYMPQGSSALRIVYAYDGREIRGVAYNKVHRQWLEAIVNEGVEWQGDAQQSLRQKLSAKERLATIQEQQRAQQVKTRQGQTALWRSEP